MIVNSLPQSRKVKYAIVVGNSSQLEDLYFKSAGGRLECMELRVADGVKACVRLIIFCYILKALSNKQSIAYIVRGEHRLVRRNAMPFHPSQFYPLIHLDSIPIHSVEALVHFCF